MVNPLKGLVELEYKVEENRRYYIIKFFRIISIQFSEITGKGIFWALSLNVTAKLSVSIMLENYDKKGWLL
jgi:hypothetical protein